MVRIVRRGQERELLRLFALREGNTRLPSVMERGAASIQFGGLSDGGDPGIPPESLRPRDGLEVRLEPRRRGPARLALRSAAPVRRGRRGDAYLRVVPRTDAPDALLGLTPELVELARARAGDLLAVCRTLAELIEGLDVLAGALGGGTVAQAARPTVLPDEAARIGQARSRKDRGQPARVAGGSAPALEREYPDGLTRREVEVLLLVAEGRTSKEIAAELCVAVPTVSRHLANIYAKIDARGRADATRYVLEHLPNELGAR